MFRPSRRARRRTSLATHPELRRLFAPWVLLLLPWAAAAAPASGQDPLLEAVHASIAELEASWVDFRRDLHRHPEVSGEEERTAGRVAERLKAAGLEVETGVGGHGVVALLRGAKPGPRVAYRADMDAVPSAAPDPVEFRSVNEGVRHICGHDIHTTIGVALAESLAAQRRDLEGEVLFVFQPAEERATGAREMLDDGLFESPQASALFALHTAPLEVGQLATRAGVMMPQRDRIVVRVRGDDAEAAVRELTPALTSAGTLQPAQAQAPQAGAFSVVQLGSPSKDASGTWTLRGMGTCSDTDTDTSTELERAVRKAVAASEGPGLEIELTYESAAIAGVTNDPTLTQRATHTAEAVLGEGNVAQLTTLVPAFSEDFGSLQQKVPGTMFFLGVSNSAEGIVGMPHSPGYVADEGSIQVGARAMAAVLLDAMRAAGDAR